MVISVIVRAYLDSLWRLKLIDDRRYAKLYFASYSERGLDDAERWMSTPKKYWMGFAPEDLVDIDRTDKLIEHIIGLFEGDIFNG